MGRGLHIGGRTLLLAVSLPIAAFVVVFGVSLALLSRLLPGGAWERAVSDENGDARFPRRELLVRGGVIAGAAALAGAGGYVAARELSDDDQVSAAPEPKDGGPLFALDPAYTNLTTFLLAQHPRPVREAIERHRRGLDAGTGDLPDRGRGLRGGGARRRGQLPRHDPEQVALTDSTTMGIGLAYARMRFEPGDEVADDRARLLRDARVSSACASSSTASW